MTSNSDPRERERLKETLAPSSECATLEELSALADASLAAPSRGRVAVHVASCKRCEVELLLLKEFESATPRPEEEAAVDLIVTRLRRRFREGRLAAVEAPPDASEEKERFWHRPFRMRTMAGTGLGLATAMLVVAVGLRVSDGREPSLPAHIDESAPVFRSAAVELRGPAGDLDGPPAELEWAPVATAASYSVQVMEVDRSELWTAEVLGSHVALPAAVHARLVPGKPLLWRVEAKDAAGRTIATSMMQRFRVRVQTAPRAEVKEPSSGPRGEVKGPSRAPRTEVTEASSAPRAEVKESSSAPAAGGPRAARHGSELAGLLPGIPPIPALRCAAAAAFPPALTPLSLKVLSRSAPPGGTAQLTLALTEPKPIATGCGLFVATGPAFDSVLGAALFTAAGAPSDVAGAAVVDGTSVRIQAISPSQQFGNDPFGAPIAVVTFHVSPLAAPGDGGKMTLDPGSLWFDPQAGLYPEEIKPGSFEVAGSVSIDNVIPGSGFLPAGSTVTVMGTGFVPETVIEIDDVPAVATYIGPNQIDLVTGAGAEFLGRRLRARNPDRFRASYYSYLRATRVGESSRALLAKTMPIFPSNVFSAAFVPVVASGAEFFALAVQNPNAGPAVVAVDLRSIDGAIASTTLTLPARSKISRELSELFPGVTATPGYFLSVSSDQPVQVLGLTGDDAAFSVTPVLPSLAFP